MESTKEVWGLYKLLQTTLTLTYLLKRNGKITTHSLAILITQPTNASDDDQKSVTRHARKCEASRVYQLTENTPLPSQKAVLTVSSNKKQLMSIICSSIINDEEFHAQHTTRNKLIIHSGATVPIVADDTDVFILLLFHYLNERLTCPMFMGSPIQQRSLIDIKATVQAHRSIIRGLPAAHALSGCDTVPTYFGIGKGTVLKNLIAAPNSLSWFGCLDAPGLLRCAFI